MKNGAVSSILIMFQNIDDDIDDIQNFKMQ